MICVPIVEKTYDSAINAAKNAVSAGADLIEFRIDSLSNPEPEKVSNFLEEINYPTIATNRRIEEGGFFKGSELERIEILLAAAEQADMIDIELGTNEEQIKKIVKVSKSTIISFHDFNKTPSVETLLKVVKREKELGDIAKFAVMPQTISDTLVVLNVLSQVQNTVGISMGDLGKYTRVVAPIFGSPITFASYDNKSAPGQFDIHITKKFLLELGNMR